MQFELARHLKSLFLGHMPERKRHGILIKYDPKTFDSECKNASLAEKMKLYYIVLNDSPLIEEGYVKLFHSVHLANQEAEKLEDAFLKEINYYTH